MHRALSAQAGVRWGRPRRGWEGQGFTRTLESDVRRAAVALARWAVSRLGRSLDRVARALSISPRTLRAWVAGWRGKTRRRPVARGAPAGEVTREQRDLVYHVLVLVSPSVPVRVIEACCPGVPRALIEDYRERFWAMARKRLKALVHTLRWPRPGTVWTTDFREESLPTDGTFRYTLLVRDLGSGMMLAAVPCEVKTSATVAAVLRRLFAEHGAPLVLKSDNGGEFLGEEVEAVLREHGVWPLLSPAYMPKYNGAVEAGGGGFATRAFHHAARNGRPEQWTCDDVEWAVWDANWNARPLGAGSPTPVELWVDREPLADLERTAFTAHVLGVATPERYYTGVDPRIEFDPWVERSLGRVAVARALLSQGYLQVRRRRVPLPKSAARWAGIA